MVVAASGLLLVVAGCTCGWWWQAMLVYGGEFVTVLCLCLCTVVGLFCIYSFILMVFF